MKGFWKQLKEVWLVAWQRLLGWPKVPTEQPRKNDDPIVVLPVVSENTQLYLDGKISYLEYFRRQQEGTGP